MKKELLEAMDDAIQAAKNWGTREVKVIHHNDADGLASAAILRTALLRADFQPRLLCLEKPYPQVLKKLHSGESALLIYLDFAGRSAKLVSKENAEKNLTLIMDHHVAEESTDRFVYNLDPELYGIKGDREIAGATVAYLFAKVLDSRNKDLAYLAVIGAVGDSHDRTGRLTDYNRESLLEAVDQDQVKIEKENGKENYVVPLFNNRNAREVADYITVLGSAGYYGGGPELGVQVCTRGFAEEFDREVAELKKIMESAYQKTVEKLEKEGLKETDHIQWFHVHDDFVPMGVKVIGLFCSYIRQMAFIKPDKYIAGFQNLGSQIPGLGKFDWDEVKISMRVPPKLEAKVLAGKMPSLAYVLPEATRALGGFADACHSNSAASTIARGTEEELIKRMEEIIQNLGSKTTSKPVLESN